MEIQKIQLEHAQKNGFASNSIDGICHIKTLPYLSVVQAVEGNYDIRLGSDTAQNTEGGGFFVAPANIQQTITHHTDRSSLRMVCRWVFLKIKINDLYDFDDLFQFPVLIPQTQKQALDAIFDRLFDTNNIFDEYICYYEIIKILSVIARRKTTTIPPYLADTLAYIREHYAEKITIDQLADSARLSSSHFFAVFKNALGVSPIAYLRNYRLTMAADLILNSDMTITEIADVVGINDPIYFNKIFRKAYQMSPTRYRQLYTNNT